MSVRLSVKQTHPSKLRRPAIDRPDPSRLHRPAIEPPKPYPHVLRYTYAHMLLAKGVAVTAVSELMGHEDVSTTAGYLTPSTADAAKLETAC